MADTSIGIPKQYEAANASSTELATSNAPVSKLHQIAKLVGDRLIRHGLLLAVLLGCGLRVSQYSHDRSLFLDEVFIAINIAERDVAGLAEPLEFDQRAPIGFLAAVKACAVAFGGSDLSLRIIPLLSGLLACVLFAFLAKRLLSERGAILATVGFAISPTMIFFSSDLKQYSTDVLMTIAILMAMLSLFAKSVQSRHVWMAAATGAFAIWFSFPSVFVLSGVALAVIVDRVRQQRSGELRRLSVIPLLWGVSCIGCYLVQIRHFDSNPHWRELWNGSFMPLPPTSFSDVVWFARTLAHLVTVPVGLGAFSVGLIALACGLRRFSKESLGQTVMLVAPVAVTMLASGLLIYPFQGRVIVFIAPIVFILLAAGLTEISRMGRRGRLIAGFGMLLLAFEPVQTMRAHLARGEMYKNGTFWDYKFEETKPVLSHIQRNWREGDVVYLYSDAHVAFRYYAPQYGIDPKNSIRGIQSALMNPKWDEVGADLAKLEGRKRVWVFFTHVWQHNGVDDRKLYLYFLDKMGKRIDSIDMGDGKDGSAYLYDLSLAAPEIRLTSHDANDNRGLSLP